MKIKIKSEAKPCHICRGTGKGADGKSCKACDGKGEFRAGRTKF